MLNSLYKTPNVAKFHEESFEDLPEHLRLDENGSRAPTVSMVERWRV